MSFKEDIRAVLNDSGLPPAGGLINDNVLCFAIPFPAPAMDSAAHGRAIHPIDLRMPHKTPGETIC